MGGKAARTPHRSTQYRPEPTGGEVNEFNHVPPVITPDLTYLEPDHSTIAEVRKRHEAALGDLFGEVVTVYGGGRDGEGRDWGG